MDLRIFERSPAIAPLLVRLYEGQKLYSLAKDKRPLAQAELTSAVSDLLDIDLSAQEQELLTDVLIALMRQAERELRQAVAERLAGMASVPLRLVLHLVNDEIDIAAPVLKRSPVLSDLDLIYIIKSQGADYWRAIAARQGLSAQVVNLLAETHDVPTAVILSENDRIALNEYAVGILARVARDHESVARPLLRRAEIPYQVARDLYGYVGAELKEYIRSFYGVEGDAAAAEKIVDDVVIDFTAPVGGMSEFMPTERMMENAEQLRDLNMLSMQLMVEALQKGKIPNFIAMFARYTDLSPKRIHDFLRQSCPKGMAIACRAFGVQKSDFSRIYLMTHRMRSRDRIVNHGDMLELLAYFDKIRPETAMRIVRGSSIAH